LGCSSLAVGVDVDIAGAVGRIARSLRAAKGRLRDVDEGSGPSADKFDKIVSISILVFLIMSVSGSVSGRTFIPTSSSPSSKGVEVEVDPEYSVGVELGAEVAAVARELEPDPEPDPDPDAVAEPDPRGKPCILSSPSTSSLREEEPTAGDCDWRRSGIQGRW
jgi:hypothetical protein